MQSDTGDLVVDVVCGMRIDPAKAVATVVYKGKIYYFCAIGCKVAFVEDPERYLHPARGPMRAYGELQL